MNIGGTGGESAYQALARELRTAILQHQYTSGQRLPTEAELAEQHGVSRQTVRRAFQDLVAEGMVYRVPGRGTFPAAREGQYLRQFGSVDDLMGLSLDTEFELSTPLQRKVDVSAAGRLRLHSDAVSTVRFRRLHEGVPFCATTVHLPPRVGDLLTGTPELTTPGARSTITVLGLLDHKSTAPVAEADQSISVAMLPAEDAELLAAPAGSPVLRIDRLYHDSEQHPVELAISHFLPEHYSYRVRLRRSVR
ncbi:GntR family transcriptional regulator [Parasphingorhabdus pacifica]